MSTISEPIRDSIAQLVKSCEEQPGGEDHRASVNAAEQNLVAAILSDREKAVNVATGEALETLSVFLQDHLVQFLERIHPDHEGKPVFTLFYLDDNGDTQEMCGPSFLECVRKAREALASTLVKA